MGDLVGDGVEVVEGELDVGLSRDGQQVEDRVGGPAQCHDDGDGVEEGLTGDDVAGGDAAFEEPHHGLAGLSCGGHPVAVDGRGCGAARQGHAHGLAAEARCWRCYATARALTRGRCSMTRRLLAECSGSAGTDGLESVDEGDLLLRTVGEAGCAGHGGAVVEEHTREVEAGRGHEHAGYGLVAAGEGTEPSRRSADMTVSTESVMTSRGRSSACPRGPWNSVGTEIVPNSADSRGGVDALLRVFCELAQGEVAGVISFQEEATPIWGSPSRRHSCRRRSMPREAVDSGRR